MPLLIFVAIMMLRKILGRGAGIARIFDPEAQTFEHLEDEGVLFMLI